MGDAGFFRGTSSEQDGRFTDKEKKLLKQMKFEDLLDKKVIMDKVNLNVIKPWITMRINEILGMEDDVVIEYIMSQLEEKFINPKILQRGVIIHQKCVHNGLKWGQINITGFLNARRAREFMGELWGLLVEANNDKDGIPQSLVEKKLSEMKRDDKNGSGLPVSVVLASSDWKDRYQTLSGGRYSGPTKEKDVADDRITVRRSRSPRKDRNGTPPRRKAFDEKEKEREKEREREREDERKRREQRRLERREEEKKREEESRKREEERLRKRLEERKRLEDRRQRERKVHRERRRRSPSSSVSRSRSPVRPRKFTEGSSKKRRHSSSESDDEDLRRKKRRQRHSSDSEEERRVKKERKSKKHKKDKKKKKEKRRRSPTPSTASDTE